MATVYVAYCEDRHIDPVIKVFRDYEKAVLWVNEWMEQHVAHPDKLTKEDTDFAYCLSCGEESDQAFIAEVDLPES